MTTVCENAKAKVNLDLRVLKRRDDGHHDLDSLVVFADVGDRLRFSAASGLTLSIEGPFAEALTDEQDNLILKAARRLALSLGRSPDVHIVLEKHLPVASGLGGGSADAAATLRGLTRLWDQRMTFGDLMSLAQGLGADVPVCLGSRPARMTGIGDHLTPFDLPEPLLMLLVNPGTPIETSAVFNALDHLSGARPDPTALADPRLFLSALPKSANDLEAPARRLAPVIGDVLAALANQPGCHLARLSGSGATCFGLFKDRRSLSDAENRLKADHPSWWVASSSCRGQSTSRRAAAPECRS